MKRALLRLGTVALGALTGAACIPVSKYGVIDTDWETGDDAWFELSGAVVAEGTGEAIPDIQVSYGEAVQRTDADGLFTLSGEGACAPCTLTAEDVDGPANGAWSQASVEAQPAWVGSTHLAEGISIEMLPSDEASR